MNTKPISEGIAVVLDFCRNYRSKEIFDYYEMACTKIQSYYDGCGKIYFDPETHQEIYNQAFSMINTDSASYYIKDELILRVLMMLLDHSEGRPFQDRYYSRSRFKHQLLPFYQCLSEDFKASLTVSKNTLGYVNSIARDFFYYLQQLEMTDMNDICQETIYAFMKEEFQSHQSCTSNVIYVLRLICKYFHQRGFLHIPTEIIPFKLPPSRTKVYPAFKKEDMKRILSAPDRGTVMGRRDYAVLILASVTGMRAIDIANLKLSDIQWRDMSIHFIQHKTGNGVTLPLDSRAAVAVSDYLLYGRPDTECQNVFLAEAKPYKKLSDKSSILNILNKYVKLSGIEKIPYDGKSFHAFRRSMGSWLLETSTPPELISQILGHQSKDVLKRYLPLTPSKLSICSLGFEGIQVQSEVYR